MLPLQFFGQNVHFVINLFASLVFFAVFWLYFDAWTNKRKFKELFKWAGFLLLALSYVVNATVVEQSVLGQSTIGKVSEAIAAILCIAGFTAIIAGLLTDPMQKVPDLKGLDANEFTPKEQTPTGLPAVGAAGLINPLHTLPPLAVLTVCILYWRRATIGLERHLKPVAIAFGLLFVSQALTLASLWRGSDNPTISKLVAAFGPIWIADQVFLLTSVIILGRWVWQYLTRRFQSQLFMIFTSVTLAIFLLTTVSFTFLLVSNIQKSSLNNLETAANVLNYAIDGKKAVTQASTEAVAENPDIVTAIETKDHKRLVSLTSTFLHDKKQSSLIITSDTGQVLLRAENPDRFGDSISSDTSVRRALVGQSSSSVSTQDGVLAPLVYIKSAVPIRDATSHQIVGSAESSFVLNNAFVDGIKNSTGLDSAIYAGNLRSATTFVAPDGLSRWVGVKETNGEVQLKVLKQEQTFKGSLSIQNREFLAVYEPLKDIDNTVVGMLFIGQPQLSILQAAGHSVELTFVVTAILLALAIIPAYLISQYLTKQLS